MQLVLKYIWVSLMCVGLVGCGDSMQNPGAGTQVLRICLRATDLFREFDGLIDDVRIWDVALTAAQILEESRNPFGAWEDSLLVWRAPVAAQTITPPSITYQRIVISPHCVERMPTTSYPVARLHTQEDVVEAVLI